MMLSLAFELRPNVAPPSDTTGMSAATLPPRRFPDECECAVKLAKSVANIKSVEDKLSADPNLTHTLQEAQACLLESAGYDRAAYLKWVSEGEMPSSD